MGPQASSLATGLAEVMARSNSITSTSSTDTDTPTSSEASELNHSKEIVNPNLLANEREDLLPEHILEESLPPAIALPPVSLSTLPPLPKSPTKEPIMPSTIGSTTPTGPAAPPVNETTKLKQERPLPCFYLQLIHSSQHSPENFFPGKATEHTYFCYQGLKVSDFVIGIPEPYFDDAARGHALYVTGVSSYFNLDQFEKIFRKCGTVKKSIAVIDMVSKDTFRWIVMSSFEEMQNVREKLGKSKFGSQTLNVCYASLPGAVIYLDGRDVDEVRAWQHDQLWRSDKHYAYAYLEYELGRPPIYMTWFNNLISASSTDRFEGSTAESSIVQALQYANIAILPKYPSDTQLNITQAAAQVDVPQEAESSVVTSRVNGKQTAELPDAHSEKEADNESRASNTIGPVFSQAVATPVVALPLVSAVAAVAPTAPVLAASSWADIAAQSATTNSSRHLMFDLHSENKSSNSAPRVAVPVNPAVVAHAQGEPIAEQMRVVFIFNLPPTITLQDVSDAVKEGPVLNIKFAADSDNGNRYAGIVFEYARDAHTFHQVLLRERAESTPGRFRFIVDAGRDTPYPYDDELEMMGEPMYASRRLTIVKKGFFFQFSKRQLRQLLEKLITPERIQMIWLYNGGNGTVVFSDVKSAVTVKAELDRLAAGKGKGSMTAVFADLQTTFSKDPCYQDLRLMTDIEELNAD